jgi:hypothetical protein
MKPKTLLIITFLCITVSLITNAQQVDSATALTVAKNFAYENYAFRDNIAYSSIDAHIQQIITSDDKMPLLYFINISPKGYVVVSGDMRDYPICAYDEDESWSDDSMDLLPDGAKWFIDSYIEQITILSKEKFDASDEIQLLWDTYLDFNKLNPEKSRDERIIEKIGDIHWDQGKYYNAQCPGGHNVPYGSDGRCVVGCVAVAIGQIMRYWHWPYSGTGSITYTDPANKKKKPCEEADPSYGSLSTNFIKYYLWNHMPFVLNTYNYSVAELLKDAGYSVKMDYAYCSSGAYYTDARNALVNYFKFSSDAEAKAKGSGTSWNTWENYMRAEVSNNRPFYYRGESPEGGGHALVGYAYNTIGTSHSVFRFNFGWGGYNNYTWFRVRDVTSAYPLFPFHKNQGMIIGIYPNEYPCKSCPDYNYTIIPSTAWQRHYSFHTFNGCKIYRVSVLKGYTYMFKTGCGDDATADYDTELYVFDNDCSQLAYNDDGCEKGRSKVTWKATYTGYAYVRVNGSPGKMGSYTMAYREHPDELTWTGNTSTDWHTASNWNKGVIPDTSINVIIPGSTLKQPYITSNAYCKSLTINSGATLTVGGYTLNVSNDINISGILAMNNLSGIINVYGDVHCKSGSSVYLTQETKIYVHGGWEFQSGANVQLTKGVVEFTGSKTNNILCNSSVSFFNNIKITKYSGAFLGINTYSNYPLIINGNLIISGGSGLHVYSSKDLIIKGDIESQGDFQCHDGAVKLTGADQSLKMNSGNFFNNLTFNQTGTATLHSSSQPFEVKGNISIESGVFKMYNRVMSVGGHWNNTAGINGFNKGTGRVIFNGTAHQYVNCSENFYTLEVNKGAALRVDNVNHTVTCNKYEWKKGGIDVIKGTFTALDLVNNGIYGSYYVNPNAIINLHQDASGSIGLNGKLTFTNGGTINIYGGSGTSYWSLNGDANIKMNGGVLDFKDHGINIYNSTTYSFTQEITGGTIRANGEFKCDRSNFTPTGLTLELTGNKNTLLAMTAGVLHNLTISKPSNTTMALISNITINGNLNINSGTFKLNPGTILKSNNINLANNTTLWVTEGAKIRIKPSKSLISNGGFIKIEGTPSNKAVIEASETGYYNFTVNQGGTISARHAVFSDLNSGVYITGTGVVDPDNAFNHCTFFNSQNALLRIDNNQELIIRSASFPSNSATYNVYKSNNNGYLTFLYATGSFAGEDFEYDPHDRINWSNIQPGYWTGAVSTDWNTSGNWSDYNIPTGTTNVVIPAEADNQPVINGITSPVCKNLTVNPGAVLTITASQMNNASLTVVETSTFSGKLYISGFLIPFNPIMKYATLYTKNIIWDSEAEIEDKGNSEIVITGDWTFSAGSEVEISICNVTFTGTNNSVINSNSSASKFASVSIKKTNNAVTSIGSASEQLTIKGSIIIDPDNTFTCAYDINMVLLFNLTCNGSLNLHNGTVSFMSSGGTQTIQLADNNQIFNNITINCGGTVKTQKDLNFLGNLAIESGIFDPQDNTIFIKGDWINNAGPENFISGSGKVVFNGSANQYCSTSQFSILEINKPTGLLYNYSLCDITCQIFDIIEGGISISQGIFTANLLSKSSIIGVYHVSTGGVINLHQSENKEIDLRGDFVFDNDGTINIYGGISRSMWGNGDLNIIMDGGVFDFKDQGIGIISLSQYITNYSISGGTIRTVGDLICYDKDFSIPGSTVEFYSSENAHFHMAQGSQFGNVIINKNSEEGDGNYAGESANDRNNMQNIRKSNWQSVLIVDVGNNIVNDLTINKGMLWLSEIARIKVLGNLVINDGGSLGLFGNCELALADLSTLTVNNGGLIKFNGEPGKESKITHNSSGYYAFNIESGGKIGAEHTIFEYMNTDGVNIKPGAIVDIDKSFNNCLFRNGQNDGRLLTIDNSQTFSVNYATFPDNLWGGNFNVYKSENSGVVTFGGHSGNFSGGSNEYDPYSRIHWGGEIAGNVALQGVDVVSGQDICFDATSILTVAGGGNTFVVQDGGNVNLIAGHNISMLEGTSVRSGAYLHAYISNEYCTLPPAMLAAEEDNDAINETVSEKSSEVFENRINDLFRVYPNPTTGIFTLELNSVNESGSVRIEIFNLLGERILNTEQQTNSHYQLDLSGNKAGIYFIRVNNSGRIDQKKLIKY